VLKSKCLDGKCNHRVDYLIHALMEDFLPDVQARLEWQDVMGRDKDLASCCRHAIQARIPETPCKHIIQVENMRFQVHSTNTEKFDGR
jgi:hypothetical protein